MKGQKYLSSDKPFVANSLETSCLWGGILLLLRHKKTPLQVSFPTSNFTNFCD